MRQTLKLLYATCFLDVSGVTKINLDILSALGAGWEVRVCVTAPDDRLPDSLEGEFARRFGEPLKLWRLPLRERYPRFLGHLKEHGIDLVYVTHSLWLYEHAARLKRDLPKLRIVDSLHLLEPYCFRGGYPDISGNRFVHPYIDRSVLISRHLREYLVGNYPVDADKLVVVHNGIDAGRFRPLCGHNGAVRRSLRLPGSGKLVGFIGRLAMQKRPLLFIDIARDLCERDASLSCYLVGSGPLRRRAERRIARYALQERIHLLGTLDDIPSLLGETDLLLLPSAYEGAPLTILEALAVGVPVVASDVGAVGEYVDERCRLLPLGKGGAQERQAYVEAAIATLAAGKGAPGLLPAHRMDQVAESYRTVFLQAVAARRSPLRTDAGVNEA